MCAAERYRDKGPQWMSGEFGGELSVVTLSQDLFCEGAKLPGVGSSGFLKYMAAFQPNELAFVLSFPPHLVLVSLYST